MLNNNKAVQTIVRFMTAVVLVLAVMAMAVPVGTTFAAGVAAPVGQAAGPVAVAAACTTLQPDEAGSYDAWINQDNVTDNKNDSELLVKTESAKLNRSLIRFDLTGAVPTNAKVTTATLSLWVKEVKDGNATVSVHQLEDFWIEDGVTWRYQDKVSAEEWTNPGGDFNAAVLDSEYFRNGIKDYWATFNVSAAAQSWAANPAANYGVILESPVTNPKSQIKFKSSNDGTATQRPKLEVCWDVGVSVSPDNLAQGTAGQSNLYSHTVSVKDFTGEPVGLSAVSNQGWTVNIYKDVNGNGVKDAGDDPITQTSPLGPNGSTKILIEVVVPANAPNGTKDITTVTATGLNNGTVDTAKDTTLVGFPPVADPVLDGRRDLAYTQSLDSNTQDYCDASGNTLARLMTLYDVANPDYVWVVLEMDLTHADTTYGTGVHPSWGGSRSLGSMIGSDKGQVLLRDANGTLIFDVTADYLEDNLTTVSGYGSAGVTDGEGSVAVGNASQVAVESSMGYNMNRFCTNSSTCTVNGVDLFTNSPAVNADYTPTNPAFADWQFPYLYEFRFDRAAFGSAGFGSVSINNVHISPNKTGSNEIPVTPCNGSIGDRVWFDNDGDKIQDGNENGINGAMVNLYRDTGNGTFEPATDLAINTRFTAGDGDYNFTGLGPGTYFVDVVNSTIPADYVLTTANEPLKKELALGEQYKDADFGYRTLPNLAISKTLVGRDPAPIGSVIEFSIRITNTGDTVIDVLPLEDIFDPTVLQFVSATPTQSSVNNGVVRWSNLTAQNGLAVGASTSVTVRFQALKVTTTTQRRAPLAGTAVNAPVAEPLVDGLLEADYTFVGRADPNGNAPGNLYKYTGANMCFYAFVVDRSFNDNVYAENDDPYLLLDGWDGHTYGNLDGSDKAIFTVSGSGGTYADLEMDYITESNGAYTVDFFDAPINDAKTSLWYNLNNSGWNGNGPSPQYVDGNVEYHSPPYNWNDTPGQYWEWHMIYEFSIPKASVGADCGTVTLAGAHNSPSKDDSSLGMIGDYVWADLDAQGDQDANEVGIPNVRVNLYQGNTLVRTTETEPGTSGFYIFSNLPAGTYRVDVDESTLPVGYTLTTSNEPKTVNLTAGQDYRNADFGYVPGQGTIGDRVYYDINGDGGLDNDNEPGINGVTVNLYQGSCPTGSGTPFQTQITAGNGDYDFTMLPAGNYCVNVDESTLPANYSLTTANEPKPVTLAQDQDYNLADFGYRLQQPGKTCDVATVFNARDQYGTNPGDKSDYACVAIDSFPGIEIVKILNSPGTVTVGEEISYTIRLKNNGQGTLVVVPLEDTYDNSTLKFLGATPAADDSQDDGVLNWSDLTASFGQDLAPGASFDVVVRFRTLKATAGNVRRAPVAGAAVESRAALAPSAVSTTLGGVNLGNLTNYLFFFADGRGDANWQGATKGFIGNVAVDGKQAAERTSGGVPYAGTITTNDSTLGAWQGILPPSQNSGQAFGVTGQTALISGLESDLVSAIQQINGLAVTAGYASVASTSLNGLNTQNGINETFVINITSGLSFNSKINITGDAGDIFILRWDMDGNPSNGYQGQAKPSGGGAIVPLGGLKPTNFINVAGDINASGGGSNPAAPYPQGPRTNDGTGSLISGGSNFSGGGFFTGYWLTTGSPTTLDTTTGLYTGNSSSLSNGIFVGGWYSLNTNFSMTSGTSGVYVSPPAIVQNLGTIGDRVYYDTNGDGGLDNDGEPGINNVTVRLYGGSCPASGTALATKVTAGNGNYLFDKLAAGDYCVAVDSVTIPATYNLTTANEPLSVNLPTSSSNFLTADFGYMAPPASAGTIGDRVWYDSNGDGQQQATETGLNNVTVNLRSGTCAAPGGVINTAVTSGNGNYLFSGLAAGNYCVDVDNATVPSGYVLTTANDPKTVNLPTNSSSFLDADFGYMASCPNGTANVASSAGALDNANKTPDPVEAYACVEIKERGAIGDFVWYDTDMDGIEDVDEPGIPNVTLDLYRDTDGTPGLNPATDTLVDSTVTDADGGYLFTNLLPGTYFVDVTDLNGVLTGLTHTVLNQSVTDPSPAIVLPVGGVYKDADFGYVKEPGQGKALVGDTVWFDDNGDGVQQPSESGIPGVTVTIYDSNNNPIGSDVTDGNGNYLVEVPAGNGYTAAPTAGVPGGLTPTTPVPHLLPPLFPGDQYLDADFGYNDSGTKLLGTIGNLVFEDANDNGVFDLGTEKGLPGVSVDLIRDENGNQVWDAGEPIIATVTTDKNGGYLFTGVPGGNYLVHVSDTNAILINYAKSKPGTPGADNNNQADPYAIFLPAGSDNLTADFGYVKLNPNLGQIGNQVWTESDGNGLFDPTVKDVGQAGVTVDLYRNSAYYATTTTGASGDYSFVKLPSGTYTVAVSDNFGVLDGWVVTTLGPNQGSDDNNQKQPYQIVLPTGGENLTADFGYIKPNVIGDFVWYDSNRDGIEDIGEPGIPNVTLDLYQDVNGDNTLDRGVDKLMTTQVTDADGGYLFTGLGPGTYFVDVTDVNGVLTGLDQIVANQGQPDPTGPIVLTSGTVFKDADFGYVHPDGKAIVGDTVWYDTNGDGVQQPNEPGIPGVTVTIFDSGNNPIGSDVTDENGRYFVSVDPGTGYTARPTAGLPGGLTATTPVPHFLPALNAGDVYLDADFGYTAPNLGTIGNLVWEDTDNSGTVNNGELGIPGVSVDLIRDENGNKAWDTGEPIIATVTTDQDGGYLFTSLVADDYLVHVSDTNATLYPYVKSKLGSAGVNNNNQADPYAIALPAGGNNLTADFGYRKVDKLGRIGNQVWIEYSDGIFDVTQGDFGQPGVTVDLLKDGIPYATTTTGASGDYMFLNLPAGNYTVFVSDIYNVLDGYVVAPLGPNQGDDNNNQQQPYNIVLPLGGENLTADFAYTKKLVTGAIGDYVFYDTNRDAIQDVNEPGIGNVTVELYRDNGDNSFDPTQDTLVGVKTTDVDGGYLFTGLAPATYFVDVTDDNGVLTGLDHTVGLQSQPDPTDAITLVEAQVYRDADFGYVKPIDQGKAIIGDTVWYDGDGDGIQDPGEPGIPGIQVCATPLGGGTPVCDTTDENGVYQVEVPAGTYTVEPTNPPTGYTPTTPVPHGPVTVSDGDQYLDADFGYDSPDLGQISGTIWDDTPNNNGLLEGGEAPIPGVSVSLIEDTNGNKVWDPGEPIIATDTTDQDGNYLFDGVPAGDYLVLPTDTQNALNGYQPTIDAPRPGEDGNNQAKPYPIELPAGGNNPTGDFGYVKINDLGRIGNQVWYEEDGNGIYNPDSGDVGIAGVTVDLLVGNTVVATTTTGASGDYIFSGLAADTYTVRVSDSAKVLEDYILTVLGPVQGADNNNQAQAYQVVLPTAGSNMTADFGYTRPSAIGDFVWYDADEDGIEDVGEPGIANVTLDLYRDKDGSGTITPGDELIDSTVTDADGGYLFPGLVAGDYIVDVTDVNGVLAGMTQIVANQAQPDPTGKITIGAGEKYEDADFGYVEPTDPGKAIIGDTVWYDDNGDGIQQPGEPGIPGIQVCAFPVGGGAAVCDVTDSNGIYRVEVPAGTYTVQPTNAPTGLTATTPVPHGPVTVDPGEQYLDADFGYDDPGKNLLGTIGNLVFVEAKDTRDGIFNGTDEPLGGVSVDLIRDTNGDKVWDTGEPIIATVTTAAATDVNAGNYLFTGLPAGNYLVHVSDTNAVLLDYKPTILGPNQRLDNNNQVDPYWVTLVQGGDNLTADFGYYQTDRPNVGVIGNQVWTETDGDGLFDQTGVNSEDVGQPGVTVELLKDGVLYRTTTTGPSGDYSFVGLPAGNYTTRVTDSENVLASYIVTKLGPNQGADNNNQLQPYATALPTDGVNLTGDFGYILPAAIGDFVYYDTNKDAIQDVGEPGIPNVAVDLYRDTNNNGVLNIGTDEKIDSTVTDADGGYLFRDLIPGKYIVDVTDAANPNGNLGDLVHTVGNQSKTDPTPAIALAAGTVYKDADFGYYKPTQPGEALIGDTVWFDANGDGFQQPEEPGIPGITVRATDANGNTFDAVTDETGTYRITVPVGTYTVQPLNPPPGLTVTTAPVWGPEILLAGEQRLDADFGYTDNGTVFGTIGNLVFWDKNKDGVYNTGDAPLGGVSVDLIRDSNGNKAWDAGEPIIATATTSTTVDANTGNYLFPGVVAGDYLVHVSDTNAVLFDFKKSVLGANQSADNTNKADPYAVVLGVNEDKLIADFGYYLPDNVKTGVIGNQIWVEIDNNGLFNVLSKDVGQAGVTVDLFKGPVKVATTTSGASGDYSFVRVPEGTYTVQVSDNEGVLTGLSVTKLGPNQGSDNNNQRQPYTVTLAGGDVNLTADFGYKDDPTGGQSSATIGNTVFVDANNNGRFDDGEAAIGDVVLNLYFDTNNNCVLDTNVDVFVGSRTTAGSLAIGGTNYLFEYPNGLRTGNYLVDVTDPNFKLVGATKTVGGQAGADRNSQVDPYCIQNFNPTGQGNATDLTADFGYVLPDSRFTISKVLLSADVARVREVISFSIRITNTGSTHFMTLPLQDVYDPEYIQYLSATPAHNSTTANSVTWDDLLAGGSPLAPGGSVEVIVRFLALKDTGELLNDVTINVATADGIVTDPDGNGPALSNPVPLPPQSAQDVVEIVNPTGTLLTDGQVTQMTGGVALRWRTISEANVAGFNLLRTDALGNVTVLTPVSIPARFPGQAEGAAYEWMDTTAQADAVFTYTLEIIQLDGGTDRYELGNVQPGTVIFLPLVVR